MAWDSGTITSAGPHTVLSTKIQTLCGGSGVANWSFVENVPAGTSAGQSGSGTFSVDVFKCATAGTNGHGYGTDFYMGLAIPTTDGTVSSTMIVAEGYLDIAGNPSDADRGKFKRPCAIGAGTSLTTVPTGASYWLTDAYGTYNSYATGGVRGATSSLNTSGFPYYIKMTNQTLMVYATPTANGDTWGCALLDSVVTVATDSLPLIGWAQNLCGPSRLPNVVSSAISNMWRHGTRPWNGVVAQSLGGSNATNINDFWQTNGIWASRVYFISSVASSSYYLVGIVRGLLPTDYMCFVSGGTVNPGDTFTLDGNTWTVMGPSLGASGVGVQYAVRAV